MNITFVLESTFNSGGIERMLATIANAMAAAHKVAVVTAFNEGRKDFFPLSKDIERNDLGIRSADYSKPKALKAEYKHRLAQWLTSNKQDVVVSLGSLEFGFLPDINDGSKKVFWFHFAFNYDILTSRRTPWQWANTLIGHIVRRKRIAVARKYDKVVVLSKSDLKSWQKYLNNVCYIYNPITIKPRQVSDYKVKKALAVGRIERQKGFDYLVEAWEIVNKRFPDWQLDIYGGGTEQETAKLQRQINALGLERSITLKGRTEDIASAYANHSVMVLSSRYEGFVLVLLEAAACGLPMVSFDCKQGPVEIISNGEDGYLVSPVGNTQGLAEAICRLAADNDLRHQMGQKAKANSERFALEKITQEWLTLFENL